MHHIDLSWDMLGNKDNTFGADEISLPEYKKVIVHNQLGWQIVYIIDKRRQNFTCQLRSFTELLIFSPEWVFLTEDGEQSTLR